MWIWVFPFFEKKGVAIEGIIAKYRSSLGYSGFEEIIACIG
jgi:hypothetical protein